MKHALLSSLVLSLSMVSLPALAHTHLESSVPAKNSTITLAPEAVSLKFSEGLETAMCKLLVKNVKSGEVVSDGNPTMRGQDENTLQIAMKPLKKEKATFEVSWKAVSKDTHKMQGTYTFTLNPK